MLGSLRTIGVLVRYWVKGRFTRGAMIALLIGEAFSIFFILFAGGTYLSFTSRVGLGTGLSEVAWSVFLAFFLVGVIQSGFNGGGLAASGGDVDYVFTSPVPPREVFAAKVLLNSLTTVLFTFPPIFALYLRFASFYNTAWPMAVLAGLVTLVFLLMALVLSADITLSLGSEIGKRRKLWRNTFITLVIGLTLLPITLLIPGAPPEVVDVTRVLPNGLAAMISVGLVSGTPGFLTYAIDTVLLLAWLCGFALLGVRMSKGHFYELVEVRVPGGERKLERTSEVSRLNPAGRSVWSVVRLKETILISRTRERRALLINALFLSGFLVIYALSGSFQSSPTSFLFILFIIGSFGSGNAARWIEKERLWILKSSTLSLRRYVKEVYRARVVPLLVYISPVTVVVGVPLILAQLGDAGALLAVLLALPGALQIAAITMAGGMFFASKYGQSTTDDILSSQTQELTDVKRFLYQTTVGLLLVSPLMLLVLVSRPLVDLFGSGSALLLGTGLLASSLAYTVLVLNILLNRAGDSVRNREDL
jgi:hypothetical protein